jgi:GAF domain-containing protein
LREPGPVLRNISVQDWSACDREWFGATGITALAAAPLLIEGRAAGVLGIYATSPLGETTIRAMGIVADNIALAVARDRTEQQKAELLRRTQESLVRIQGLAKVSLAVNVGLSVDDVLAVVTEKARELIGAHLSVTSLTVDRSWAQAINSVSVSNKYEHWKTYDEKPSGTGIYSLVCELNKPLRMTQAELEAHPRWRERGGAADRHPPPRGWLAAPLVDARGNNIGILQLSDKHDGDFNAEDEAVVVQLAQIASAAVQSARLHRETKEAWLVARRAAERTAHLQNATAALASAMTKEEVASITHRNVAPRFGATSAEVRLLSGDQVARQPIASLGHSEGGVAGDDTIATSEAVTEVQQTGRPIFSQAAQTGTAILPLVDGDRMLGTVVFRFSQPKAFEDGDREILLTIAGQVSQALRRVRAYETAVEADRHKDEFMAMLGHELRNPLTPISTALQLMRMRGDAAFRREHDIIERRYATSSAWWMTSSTSPESRAARSRCASRSSTWPQ